MNWEPMVALGVALLSLAAAWIQRQGIPGKDRRRLRSDAEIFALLPEDSPSRRLLGEHLDAEVERLVKGDSRGSTSFLGALGSGLAVLVFYLIPGVALIWAALHFGGWWWIGGVVGILFIGMAFAASISLFVEEWRGEDEEKPQVEEAEIGGQNPPDVIA